MRRLAAVLLLLPAAALADFARGVDAYQRGSYAEAARELTIDAEAGNPEAQRLVGQMYSLGLGVPQDPALGHAMLDRAARQGDTRAAEELAQVQEGEVHLIPPPSMRRGHGHRSAHRHAPAPGSDDVRALQRDLNRLGYHAGPVDGIVGRLTRQGIRAFERDHGWPVTGRVSDRLRQALESPAAGTLGPSGR